MSSTRLTVGGFTQAGVARSLIELPANAEKGLSHRFLWLFPNPVFGKFSSLGEVDKDFQHNMAEHLAKQWKLPASPGKPVPTKEFYIPRDSASFSEYYDDIQENLKSLAGMDDLLAGMLSKSRGQVLRLSPVLHLLFNYNKEGEIPDVISEAAIKAAINFVKVTCEQTAMIAGRESVAETIKKCQSGDPITEGLGGDDATAAFCLQLPGKTLYLTPLLAQKKFRKRGNKDGAVRAFYQLEAEGLGKTMEIGGSKGTTVQYEFEKAPVPDDKVEFSKKLGKYNVSLMQYARVLLQQEIKPGSPTSMKRPAMQVCQGSPPKVSKTSPENPSPVRHSPRKSPRKVL